MYSKDNLPKKDELVMPITGEKLVFQFMQTDGIICTCIDSNECTCYHTLGQLAPYTKHVSDSLIELSENAELHQAQANSALEIRSAVFAAFQESGN